MTPHEAFTKSVVLDPLFSLEGADLEKSDAVLDALEGACQKMEDIITPGNFLRRMILVVYPLSRSVVPIAFLRAVIGSERARRRFNASSSDSDARLLIAAWHTCAKEYERSVRRFGALHELLLRLERVDPATAFQDMFGNVMSVADFRAALRTMRENAALLNEEVRRRERIVAGLDVRIDPPKVEKDEWIEGEIAAHLKPLHDLETKHSASFRHSDIIERYGPMYLSASHFGDSRPRQFMVYVLKDKRDGVLLLKAALVDAFYALDLHSKESARFGRAGRGQYLPLIERGISHWYQPATHVYSTLDHTYLARLATLVDLRRRPSLDEALVRVQRSSMLDLLLGFVLDNFKIRLMSLAARTKRGDMNSRQLFSLLIGHSGFGITFLHYNASVWRIDRPLALGGQRSRDPSIFEQLDPRKIEPEMMELIMKGGRIREEVFDRFLKT